MNHSSLYGLLDFYCEYVPAFAEHMLPLCELISADTKPWTKHMAAMVCTMLDHVLESPRWLNPDLEQEVCMETHVLPEGIMALLL